MLIGPGAFQQDSGIAIKRVAELQTYTAASHAGQVIKVSDLAEAPNSFTWAYSVNGTWKSVYQQAIISYDPIAPTAMRVASLDNYVANASATPGTTGGYIALPFETGFDQSTANVADSNWMKRSSAPQTTVFGSEAIGNGYTILQAAIEMNGVSVPVYWSGSRSVAVTDGQAIALSDDILASAFGYANGIIPKGTKGWIKFETRLPSTASKIAITDRYMPIYDAANATAAQARAWQSISFDPAVTTLSSIDAVGAVRTVSGTATTQNKWKNPVLMGRPVDANAPCNCYIGDSETAGYSDDLQPAVLGVGYPGGIQLALTAAQRIPGMNFGAVGWKTLNSKPDARTGPWMKYFKTATVMLGTNDFDGAGVTATGVYNDLTAVINEVKAQGIPKVAVLKVPPRTSGTYATEGAQTTHPAYVQGGIVDQHNALIDAAGFDLVVDLSSVKGTVDPRKWYSGSGAPWTGDGIHGTRLMQRNRMGSELATALKSFFGIAA